MNAPSLRLPAGFRQVPDGYCYQCGTADPRLHSADLLRCYARDPLPKDPVNVVVNDLFDSLEKLFCQRSNPVPLARIIPPALRERMRERLVSQIEYLTT